MLSDSGGNDNVLLSVLLAPLVERFDDLLRLHQLAGFGLRRHESEGIVRFPLCDFVEPFRSGVGGFREKGEESGEGSEDVSGDGDVGVDDLVDVLRLDLKVDDSSSTFRSSELGSGSKGCTKQVITGGTAKKEED